MKSTPNVGEIGLNSIRLGEMKICDLPIGECARAASQLPLVEDTERQNKIEDILAGFPKHRVDYLEGRIRECERNILHIQEMKSQQQSLISEYTSQISLCEFRDKEIDRISADDPARDEKISDLSKRFPPYNVSAMQQQIIQSGEALVRADEVIAQEYNSISELRETLVHCRARDAKLRALGVTVATG